MCRKQWPCDGNNLLPRPSPFHWACPANDNLSQASVHYRESTLGQLLSTITTLNQQRQPSVSEVSSRLSDG